LPACGETSREYKRVDIICLSNGLKLGILLKMFGKFRFDESTLDFLMGHEQSISQSEFCFVMIRSAYIKGSEEEFLVQFWIKE